jgi:hypothetical protein
MEDNRPQPRNYTDDDEVKGPLAGPADAGGNRIGIMGFESVDHR